MGNIHDCVDSFNSLLDIEYKIILGKKGKTISLSIQFRKFDCYHLMGLQHIKDRPELDDKSETIFDRIRRRDISAQNIESSEDYPSIKSRIDFLPKLEQVFDSNSTIFKYNPKLNAFSVIQAEFLLKNTIDSTNLFTFLSESENGNFFCRSFFPDNRTDYSANQISWTLLFKKKIHKSTNTEEILFQHKNFKNSENQII